MILSEVLLLEEKRGCARIMDEETVKETVFNMSKEVYKNNPSADVCVIGIRRRGASLGKQIADNLSAMNEDRAPLVGELDVTLHRDDFAALQDLPLFFSTSIPFDINGRHVVLVDDVLYTGRTARAALDALFLLGRPSKIELAVLIDRGHRELPIAAQYVGLSLKTEKPEYVRVKTHRFDGECAVYLFDEKRMDA